MRRYTLKYEFSTDGLAWIDFTDAVDSMQTKLNYSLCTQGFLSAKDSVNFTLPATSLPVKNQLINALMGQGDIYFRMYIPTPVPVMWNGEDVLWNSNEVLWKGVAIGFTGFIDRSSVDLRSYPLPTALTLTAYDVSVQHLDDKIDHEIVLENKKISEIVAALLLDAGYTAYDVSGIDVADDRVLDAFVAEADKSKTYRQYIDTLLFEAPGYVLDFTPSGSARIVRIPWDDTVSSIRTIDNPMNANGIQIKSAYLKEDGVKVKWSSLKWGEHMPLWRDSIDAQWDADYGDFVGEWIKMNRYWPENGELVPAFMEFSTEWLDTPYLRRDTRLQNEDLSIIMAKQGTVSASIHADRGGKPYEFPIPEGYPVPTSPTDFTDDPYNFTANPLAWAKKAWYLLYNPQWSPVTPNGTENPKGEGWYELVGGQYIKTQDTVVDPYKAYFLGATYTAVTPQGTENPAYEGWFVFDGSNYVMTTDVTVQPGTTYYEAKDGEVNLMSFVIYGDVLYRDKINTLQNDNTKNPKEYTSEYIYDEAHAKAFMNFYWHFLNTSRFSMSWAEPYKDDPLGSVVEITQKGMVYSQDAVIVAKSIQFVNDNTPIVSYSAVGVAVPTLENGVAYSITPQGSANNITPEEMDDKRDTEELKQEVEDIQVNVWDFRLSKSDYIANGRYTGNNAAINIDAKVEGWDITPQWSATCFGNNVNSFLSSTSGKNITITIPYDMDGHGGNNPIVITMSDPNGVLTPIQHSISCTDQTNWNLFCGALGAIPTTYPEGSKFLSGDYFLASTGFTGTDGNTYKGATPYYYDNGSWFHEMSVTAENYGYLMNCLGAIMDSSTIQPQDGVSAFYGWFQNLVAKSAIIENLFAQKITVLDNGCIHSEYYDDEGNINLTATDSITHVQPGSDFVITLDVDMFLEACDHIPGEYNWECDDTNAYWDRVGYNPLSGGDASRLATYGIVISGTTKRFDVITITVTASSDATKGFWLGADGTLKCFSAEMEDLTINGGSVFRGSLQCDVIKTIPKTSTPTPYSTSSVNATQGYYLAKDLVDAGLKVGKKYKAWIQGLSNDCPLAYIAITTAPEYKTMNGLHLYSGGITFYDGNLNPLNMNGYISMSKLYFSTSIENNVSASSVYCEGVSDNFPGYPGQIVDTKSSHKDYFCPNGFTLQIFTGGNILNVSIPDDDTGLSKGDLYYDPDTGVVMIKMT